MNHQTLNYAEHGSARANPVFVFHGTPGSRFEHPHDLSICTATNSRLIIVERPGYGISDFDDQHKLLDWPGRVIHLADSLNISQFSILGFSGGGAYALACGALIPDRIKRIALIGSVAPFNQHETLENMPPGNRALFELAAEDYLLAAQQLSGIITGPDALLQFLDESVCDPDKLILKDSEIRSTYRINLEEAIRQGLSGLAYDMGLIGQPWGFDPDDVKVEVDLWHGEKDLNIPVEMGRYLANILPKCRANYLANSGHWLIFSHYRQILESLLRVEEP